MCRRHAYILFVGAIIASVSAIIAPCCIVAADGGILWSWRRYDGPSIWGTQYQSVSGVVLLDAEAQYLFPLAIDCMDGSIAVNFRPGLAPDVELVLDGRSYMFSGYAEYDFIGVDTDSVTVENFNDYDSYIDAVVVRCNDAVTYGGDGYTVTHDVTYGDGGVMLALLFLVGIMLLNVMFQVAERLTDR